MRLPESPVPPHQVREALTAASTHDVDWSHGRGWSLVYDSPPWHAELVDEAAARFSHENALSASAFPSAATFESQVVSMAASVVCPGSTAHGVFTSGGTESIMVAVKGYRDSTDARRRTLVAPVTAHPAFWKAADYLGLDLRLLPVDEAGLPDVDEVVGAMDETTALVGLSAPCFPYGVVDPIEAVAAAAAERGIGVHVDAAMGGLFLPFLDAAGGVPPRFGLDVPGVTSVSVDLHKYGYGAKGASVLLFADNALRRASYYVATGWPGGAYAASGVLGTRPVGASAAAWTAMAALGRDGYRSLVSEVMTTARRLQSGMAELGLRVLGDPPMGVFAVSADEAGVGIPSLAAAMSGRGWWIDTQEDPASMHFVVFPRHGRVAETFLSDLSASLDEARARPAQHGGTSYGVMVRGGTIDDSVLREHLDARFDSSD